MAKNDRPPAPWRHDAFIRTTPGHPEQQCSRNYRPLNLSPCAHASTDRLFASSKNHLGKTTQGSGFFFILLLHFMLADSLHPSRGSKADRPLYGTDRACRPRLRAHAQHHLCRSPGTGWNTDKRFASSPSCRHPLYGNGPKAGSIRGSGDRTLWIHGCHSVRVRGLAGWHSAFKGI